MWKMWNATVCNKKHMYISKTNSTDIFRLIWQTQKQYQVEQGVKFLCYLCKLHTRRNEITWTKSVHNWNTSQLKETYRWIKKHNSNTFYEPSKHYKCINKEL